MPGYKPWNPLIPVIAVKPLKFQLSSSMGEFAVLRNAISQVCSFWMSFIQMSTMNPVIKTHILYISFSTYCFYAPKGTYMKKTMNNF